MGHRSALRALAAATALLTASCAAGAATDGTTNPGPTEPTDTGTYSSFDDSMLTTEFLTSGLASGTHVWIQGLLLEVDGTARICGLFEESDPARCVDGITITGVPEEQWTHENGGTRWNDGIYSMLVEVVSGAEAVFVEMPPQVG